MKGNTRRKDIIEAYAKVIEDKGIEGASLGAVASSLGIPQSLIFHYFKNKEELTTSLADTVAEECAAFYEKAWPLGEYTRESFISFVEYTLEIHRNRRGMVSPKLYMALVYLMPRQPGVVNAFIKLTDDAIDRIVSQLKLFGEAGIIKCADHRMAAMTLMCLADGILCYDGLFHEEERLDFIKCQRDNYLRYVGFNN